MADGENTPEVYICAADKENADIIYRACVFMIEHSHTLSRRLRLVESQRKIHDDSTGGILKVMSTEAVSKHGFTPSCVIFDELHTQPNRKLWDVMTFGAGSARRQPVWIVLTTAGDDPDRHSIAWEQHEKAVNILKARGQWPWGDDSKAKPEHERPRDDPLWLPVVYGMPDDPDECARIDIYDEKLWFRLNPSLGVTLKLRTLRNEARNARQSEAAERLFRWLRLNQWIATKTVGWLPLTLYDRTQWHGEAETLIGKKCYGGLDLSSTTDLSALALLFPPQDGLDRWVALFQAWMPTEDIEGRERRDHVPYRDWIRAGFLNGCEGDMIDFGAIEEAVLEAFRTYKLKLLGADQYLSRMMSSRLAKAKIPVAEIPQSMLGMSPAMKEIERLLRAKRKKEQDESVPIEKMEHAHNTCARWCFGNVRCAVDGNENLKPMKNRSIGRIDIAVAWIIAMAAAMLNPGPDYDTEKLEEDWSL